MWPCTQKRAGLLLQRKIADCLAKAGVGAQEQELNHQVAENERIERAWEMYELFYANSKSQHRVAVGVSYLLVGT